jgi:hypothetical protein
MNWVWFSRSRKRSLLFPDDNSENMQPTSGFASAAPPPIKDHKLAAAFRKKQSSAITIPAIILMVVFALGAACWGLLALFAFVGGVIVLFSDAGDSDKALITMNHFVPGQAMNRLAVFQGDPFGPPLKRDSLSKKGRAESQPDSKSTLPPAPIVTQSETQTPFLTLLILLFVYTLMMVINLALCYGAYSMKRHDSFPVALITCIAAICPISMLWCVSLPIGIWGLVAINRNEVKLLFQK